MADPQDGRGGLAKAVLADTPLPLGGPPGRRSAPDPEGAVRARLGIRFHLVLAAVLLIAFALAIGSFSTRLTLHAREAGAEHTRALEAAVAAAHTAFEAATRLPVLFGELARAVGEDRQADDIAALAAEIAAVRRALAQVSGAPGHPSAPGIAAASPVVGSRAPPGRASAGVREAERATDLVEEAASHLAGAVSRRIKAHAAAVARMSRLASAHGLHFDASTRIEVSMRALTAKGIAVDLAQAAGKGRLQGRIDEILEREMSWVATAQDLRTDSRELMGLARTLLAEPDPARLDALQRELDIYSRRLALYRRLPEVPPSGSLREATEAYVAAVQTSPSLAELRRSELEAESAVTVAQDAAGAANDALNAALYDLAQDLVKEGQRVASERTRVTDAAQIVLQGSALGAGFLVLGLVGSYLRRHVVRPLERLTEAMQSTSRRLSGGSALGMGPESLPDAGQRQDEVGIMTQALRVLHRALAEREQALLEQQTRLHYLAYHDALTGLPNRALLSDRIEQAMTGARRRRRPLAVALMDLDGFKGVNDGLGHAAGDALLVAVANRVRAVLRETDTLGRLGGDELALLLPDLDRADDAQAVLERVRACFQEPFDLGDGHRIATSASIGYTLFPEDDCPGDVLMRHADQAMYGAKRLGKDRLQRYEPD